MSSVHHDVHLVDIDGFDVPVGEKDLPPHDPTDPANWPAWTDNFYWECEPAVMAELEAAAIAEECDRCDAPPSFSQWLDSQGGIAWEEGGLDDPFARAEAEDADSFNRGAL
jgi:hypothetical protein